MRKRQAPTEAGERPLKMLKARITSPRDGMTISEPPEITNETPGLVSGLYDEAGEDSKTCGRLDRK
jgi:hypothetical protein